jgi:hypothetical protein
LHVYSMHVLLGYDMIQDKTLLPVRYFGRLAFIPIDIGLLILEKSITH